MSQYEIVSQVNPKLSPKQLEFSCAIQEKIRDFLINPDLYKAEASELENMIDSGREIQALGDLSNIPLKVIGRDGDVEISNLKKAGIPENEAETFENLIQKLSKSKASYSKNGKFILAKGSGHNIHLDCPDIVIRSIEELI